VNHPELDAAGICVECRKGLCIECKRELGAKLYCQSCADAYTSDAVKRQTATQHQVDNCDTQPTHNNSEYRRKSTSNILIGLGVAGNIIALFLLYKGLPGVPDEGAEGFIRLLISYAIAIPAILVSFLLLAIGVGMRFTKSTAAVIYGILGLLSGLYSVLAIAFGSMSLAELKKNPSLGSRKKAIASLALGIIGIVAWILGYLFGL